MILLQKGFSGFWRSILTFFKGEMSWSAQWTSCAQNGGELIGGGILRAPAAAVISLKNQLLSQRPAQSLYWPQGISIAMPTLPTKLEHDAIVEAVFEVRFDPGKELPEIVLGRLADLTKWPGFTATRLPFADLPHVMRMSDPNLMYQPSIQLSAPDSPLNVKIGTHAIVCSMPKPYKGWAEFHKLHLRVIDDLFALATSIEIRRLGLRYVNVLEATIHHIGSISELQLAVTVGAEKLVDSYNLNFQIEDNDDTHVQVRVATKNFTLPPLSGDANTLIDIDVYTPEGFCGREKSDIEAWLAHARNVKNIAFFRMFSDAQIKRMQES